MDGQLNIILEAMIDKMGDGGMDVSYSGTNYEIAKIEAIKEIKNLINQKDE